MDWGAIVWFFLGIAGAALIAGGVVAYRRSVRTGVRSLGAASVATGVAMWLVVALTVPVSTS